ncbi:hypothetical protein [Actinacidiphila glaucinigra]|uniref:hypothetical protein n=1 Tax=Actinacidiphila glaucinigra TaxID=235986 RepID=UPI003723365E
MRAATSCTPSRTSPTPKDPAAWDNEFGPWHSRPDVRGEATAADYDAEYLRVAALLRERLGEPEPASSWPYEDIDATRHVRWARGDAYVILLDGSDAMSYGAYRRAGVAVRPRRWGTAVAVRPPSVDDEHDPDALYERRQERETDPLDVTKASPV